MFKLPGILVAIYIVRRPSMVERSAEPRWTVITTYGARAVALIAAF